MDKLFTVGVGFTVNVNVCCGPGQLVLPFEKVGVTVIVAVTGAAVEFVAVNAGIPVTFPPLLAARPIEGALFVHE